MDRVPDALRPLRGRWLRYGTSLKTERQIVLAANDRANVFLLMLAGFAVEGFVLSAILVRMVPLTAALGMGASGLTVESLFGPSQVARRFINMLFRERLSQVWLAIIAAILLPLALVVLLATTPWIAGSLVLAVLFGLGSGLASIVGGTLPLELFGRDGYDGSPRWLLLYFRWPWSGWVCKPRYGQPLTRQYRYIDAFRDADG